MLVSIILTVHVLVAIAIVILVLLQHGKGADMGAAFGTGSAGSLFGASGAANFLSRSTAVCATVFFVTSLGLTYFHAPRGQGVTSDISRSVTAQPEAKKEAPKAAADAIPAPGAPSGPATAAPDPSKAAAPATSPAVPAPK
jgi:preprotein translocase subunit SecG